MRPVVFLAAVMFAAALAGQGEFAGPVGLPVFFDAAYEWRSRADQGWQRADAMFRLPAGLFAGKRSDLQLHTHKFGLQGCYERAYGDSPNAERAGLLSVYTWGIDDADKSAKKNLPDLSDYGFPFQRSSGVAAGLSLAVGWMRSTGTRDEPESRADAPQDSIRLEHTAHLSVMVLGFRQVAAVNINLRDGRTAEFEFGFWITAGDGIFPVGVALGYYYLGTERAGGGWFSLRFSVRL